MFYRRETELTQLWEWMVSDSASAGKANQCRVVAILGIGGSCLLLTSREKPREIALMEGEQGVVR